MFQTGHIKTNERSVFQLQYFKKYCFDFESQKCFRKVI